MVRLPFIFDYIAYDTISKIRSKENLGPLNDDSVFKELSLLNLKTSSDLRFPTFLRIVFTDKQNFAQLIHYVKESIKNRAEIKKCEIIIEIKSENWADYQEYISSIILYSLDILGISKIRTSIIIKAHFEFFTLERLAYLKEKRLFIVAIIERKNYDKILFNDIRERNINHFELINDNLNNFGLKDYVKNFIVFNNQITSNNYSEYMSKIKSELYKDDQPQICESFQNISNVFKILTSRIIPNVLIYSSKYF